MEIFVLGIKGVEVRSDSLKGETMVYYPITSSSCRTIKDVRIGEMEECLNLSIYTCGGGDMFCLMQLY